MTLECARELLDQVLTDETRKITEDRTFSANQED